jgi:hypothetical protein
MEGQLTRMLDHGREHRRFYRAALATAGFRALMVDYLVRHARQTSPGLDPRRVRFGAAALVEAFASHVEDETPEPAAEVARDLARFLMGGLGAPN